MVGSGLRRLASRFERILDVILHEFQNQKRLIGGRGLQISESLKMFPTITTTMRTFICVDTLIYIYLNIRKLLLML